MRRIRKRAQEPAALLSYRKANATVQSWDALPTADKETVRQALIEEVMSSELGLRAVKQAERATPQEKSFGACREAEGGSDFCVTLAESGVRVPRNN
jgi:hypothetical protein